MKLNDLTGQRFGRLTVIERAPNKKSPSTRWRCKCDCGKETISRGTSLTSGATLSCGCMARERIKEAATKHGGKGTRLYNIWTHMKQRTTDKNYDSYHNYGGRGITICDEWLEFEPFRDWALANGYRDDLTLDRKDNNGPYSPENCRWANAIEQGSNRRTNRTITARGQTKTMTEWASELGITPQAICRRIDVHGWTPEEAVTIRKHERRKNK